FSDMARSLPQFSCKRLSAVMSRPGVVTIVRLDFTCPYGSPRSRGRVRVASPAHVVSKMTARRGVLAGNPRPRARRPCRWTSEPPAVTVLGATPVLREIHGSDADERGRAPAPPHVR